tara:strand:- start:575 stop:919 length:345 start_codon:yes stop_codon:yes gene_type:complete
MKYWKCMECDSITHHKGLCRECTTYDEKGKILTPVPRTRVDSNGNAHVVEKGIRNTVNLNLMKRKFVDSRRKKLTRKQLALAKKEAEALKAAQQELEAENDGEMVEFGEAVEEE